MKNDLLTNSPVYTLGKSAGISMVLSDQIRWLISNGISPNDIVHILGANTYDHEVLDLLQKSFSINTQNTIRK